MFVLTLVLHFSIAGNFHHDFTVTWRELSGTQACDERANDLLRHADRRIGHWGKVEAEVVSCVRDDGRRA